LLQKRCGIPNVIYWKDTCSKEVAPDLGKEFLTNFVRDFESGCEYSLYSSASEALKRAKETVCEKTYEVTELKEIEGIHPYKWKFVSRKDPDASTRFKMPEGNSKLKVTEVKVDGIVEWEFPGSDAQYAPEPVGELIHLADKSSLKKIKLSCTAEVSAKTGEMLGKVIMSPIAPLSLRSSAGEKAEIPSTAFYYAYVHRPVGSFREHMELLKRQCRHQEEAYELIENFLSSGGYAYFDSLKNSLQLNVLFEELPKKCKHFGKLYFSEEQIARYDVIQVLELNDRFGYKDENLKAKICWTYQREVLAPGASLSDHGAFITVDEHGTGKIIAVIPGL